MSAGKYVDGVTSFCTGKREHTAVYVGGLDAAGAPHGAGVWSDSFEFGEFLVGCAACPCPPAGGPLLRSGAPLKPPDAAVPSPSARRPPVIAVTAPSPQHSTQHSGSMTVSEFVRHSCPCQTHSRRVAMRRRFDHGHPIAPMRARTNTGSSSVAYRIAVLSCRTDATDSTGSFGGGTPATPLRAGVASVECCTCGLFYNRFPRVTWLQVVLPWRTSPACKAE